MITFLMLTLLHIVSRIGMYGLLYIQPIHFKLFTVYDTLIIWILSKKIVANYDKMVIFVGWYVLANKGEKGQTNRLWKAGFNMLLHLYLLTKNYWLANFTTNFTSNLLLPAYHSWSSFYRKTAITNFVILRHALVAEMF